MKKLPRIAVACPSCGSEFQVTEAQVARGRGRFCSRACGARYNGTKHGHTSHTGQSRTYATWATMLQRCENPAAPKYETYGARGIDVSRRWHDFAQFLADMGERPPGKTLDRIDGRKGYSKSNCRWATPAEQSENTSITKFVSYQGERISMTALSRLTGVSKTTLQYRIAQGWPEDQWAARPSALYHKG